MTGDSALLYENIMSRAAMTSITMMSMSHRAFLTLRNAQTSPSNVLFFNFFFAIGNTFFYYNLQSIIILIISVLFAVPHVLGVVCSFYQELVHHQAVYACSHHALVSIIWRAQILFSPPISQNPCFVQIA